MDTDYYEFPTGDRPMRQSRGPRPKRGTTFLAGIVTGILPTVILLAVTSGVFEMDIWLALGMGAILAGSPTIILFWMTRDALKRKLILWAYGSRAMLVKIICPGKRTKTVIGRMDQGKKVRAGGLNHQFNPEEVGLEGKLPSVILRHDGSQVSLTGQNDQFPTTTKEIDIAIAQAYASGTTSGIGKIDKMILILIANAIMGGISVFFLWNLVEALI